MSKHFLWIPRSLDKTRDTPSPRGLIIAVAILHIMVILYTTSGPSAATAATAAIYIQSVWCVFGVRV